MVLEPDLTKNRQNSEYSSKRVSTLKKRSDFLRLRTGRKYSTRSLVLQAVKSDSTNSDTEPRVGFTVTKKVGNAVVRNRIKRRLREAAQRVIPQHSSMENDTAHDYVIIGKHGALTRDFTAILKDLQQALDHVHMNKAKGLSKTDKSGDAAKNITSKNNDTQ